MADYVLTAVPDVVRRTSDGAFIPFDENNADYQEYLAWLDDGNEPAPYVAPPAAKPAPKRK